MVHLLNELPTRKAICLVQNYSIDEKTDVTIEVNEHDTVADLLRKVSEHFKYSVHDFFLIYEQYKLDTKNEDYELNKIGLQFDSAVRNLLRIEYNRQSLTDIKNANNFLNHNDPNANIVTNHHSNLDNNNINNNNINNNNNMDPSPTMISSLVNQIEPIKCQALADSDWDDNLDETLASVKYDHRFIREQGTSLKLDYPIGDSNNNEPSDGFVGLVNQAMTCYLNSLLQSLFMTPEFRNAIYMWEYNGVAEKKPKIITYQLQKLFINLQTSTRTAVHTNDLTSSFGWTSNEAWQQHDIQELCRVMFDALEKNFVNTPQADLINRLYQGKMLDCIKCEECHNVKSREDIFLDIPLQVRQFGSTTAFRDIKESLRDFIRPELLNGANQYFCEKCNKKCDAKKALIFQKFPYILTLHLKRFDYDFSTANRIKINDRITFPFRLDLSEFIGTDEKVLNGDMLMNCDNSNHNNNHMDDCDNTSVNENPHVPSSNIEIDDDDDEEDVFMEDSHINNIGDSNSPYLYDLFSIMVHSGSANGGHYFVYIKNFTNDKWYSFNDQTVSKITFDDIQKVYGAQSRLPYNFSSSSGSAYMLFYRQVSKDNAKFLPENEFPPHLLQTIAEIKKVEDGFYASSSNVTETQIEKYYPPPAIIDVNFIQKVCYCKVNSFLQMKNILIDPASTIARIRKDAIKLFDLNSMNITGPVRLLGFNSTFKHPLYSFENLEFETFEFVEKDGQLKEDNVDFLLQISERKFNFLNPITPLVIKSYGKIIHLNDNCISEVQSIDMQNIVSCVNNLMNIETLQIYCLKRNTSTQSKFIYNEEDLREISEQSDIVLYVSSKFMDENDMKQLCHQLDNCVTFYVKIRTFSEHDLATRSIPTLNIDHDYVMTNGFQNGDNKEIATNYYIQIYFACEDDFSKTYKVVANKKIRTAKLKKELESRVGVPMKYFGITRFDEECKDNDQLVDILLTNDEYLNVVINRCRANDEIFARIYYLDFTVEDKFVYLCEWFIKINETVNDVKTQILAQFPDLKNKYPGLCVSNCRVLRKSHKTVDQVYLDNQKICKDDLDLQNNCEICLKMSMSLLPEPITDKMHALVYVYHWKPSIAEVGEYNEIVVDFGESEWQILAAIKKKLEFISDIPRDFIEICPSSLSNKLKISAIVQKKWASMDLKLFAEWLQFENRNGVFFMFYKDSREKIKEISEKELDEIRKREHGNVKSRTNINSRKDKSLRIHVET